MFDPMQAIQPGRLPLGDTTHDAAHTKTAAQTVAMADELKTERIQLLMTPSEVKAIDDWSFEQRIRGRSEAIRRLIELGLEAAKGAGGSKARRTAPLPSVARTR